MNKQQTEMKEYLSQAFRIDQRIQSKMEQVASLNDLATRATATYSDMPGSETRNLHRMEDAILSIIELEAEINEDSTRPRYLLCWGVKRLTYVQRRELEKL